VSPLFSNVNPILFVLGALFGALSLAFFNYVEGVMKDVPKKFRLESPNAYQVLINALTELKREVIVNVILVVILVVFAYVVGAVSEMEFLKSSTFAKPWIWGVLSIRGACLMSVVIVMVVQAAGFVTANQLRAQISMSCE
jgi:pheromone shutdown protein TraB